MINLMGDLNNISAIDKSLIIVSNRKFKQCLMPDSARAQLSDAGAVQFVVHGCVDGKFPGNGYGTAL